MSKRGLGKGLDALLATSSFAREKQHIATQSQALSSDGELRDLAITSLQPGVYQPRKDMAPEALEELAASIQSQGIIQPIVVRQVADDKFEIIAGERRWRAARQAGLRQVPCLVKNVQDRAAIAMALIENIQRENLNVIEEAQALERLQDEFTLTHQQVADVIGKSRTTVSNLLRLNQLDDQVKQLVAEKLLEMGHARALLALEGEQQCEIAQQVAKKQLTVRQTEKLVKKCLAPQADTKNVPEDADAQQMSHKLSEILDAKVSIVRSKDGKAKMTISLDEPHKLEQLIAKLES
ncbi:MULTISPECIES: ParB/RepB/Spo0J family partition protein [Vibrio]|uniref:Probable chromosome-partitioning protein ParB n=1 Tax=Vibrio proteolyticus NBRC 13287 TaxID=1219065 RepID=U3A5T7_VIBPR|nr:MULTISPECIES: ParB/RepB/Spo0J family partition protein [Vibrio]NAW58017.1 ParB/RepB/Spo0J family partition protein [Vibrio sp. V36_P2S2PM302]NAX22524.1 ParB/RepB/Spo0J family partition protein [Vibrio sp. V39_P1S14PM300]NAX26247.1 ParB/RepB/Spo0J family partition protein [Vibrio sp. V38_P2S17PM301]NAX31454.1 ParB/RepB/Spo0J family partition protein [Vibrio sp. V37_P2S8PM304]GAD69070.1 chromosome partitioning protein ParB [Vibrio proteolyticus NBRC 13287]